MRATFTCSAFVDDDSRPVATTVYVPICAYAHDDAEAQRRVRTYLAEHGMNPEPYDALIRGYAHRPLEAGVGLQSWIAFRRSGTPWLTIYLSTEASRVHPPGSIPAGTEDRHAFASPQEVIRCVREYDLAQHPFVRRLMREGAMATLLHMVHGFDDRLGHHAPADATEALAARFAGDLAARQIASAIDRRNVAPLDLTPITALPSSATEPVRRGALGLHRSLWRALDALYVERFGRAPTDQAGIRRGPCR